MLLGAVKQGLHYYSHAPKCLEYIKTRAKRDGFESNVLYAHCAEHAGATDRTIYGFTRVLEFTRVKRVLVNSIHVLVKQNGSVARDCLHIACNVVNNDISEKKIYKLEGGCRRTCPQAQRALHEMSATERSSQRRS